MNEQEQAADARARRLEDIREWRRQAKEKRDALRQRLEELYPVVPECVRNDLWEWAWEEGHSAGLREVEFYYEQIVSIVEKVVMSLS